jgi:hypothetical protein
MLEKCQKYALAINAKGRPFPTEPVIMTLLLEQHKVINWLQNKIPIINKESLIQTTILGLSTSYNLEEK